MPLGKGLSLQLRVEATYELQPQFSLSIWDEERIGECGEAKRPQGEIKSTHTGYYLSKPSAILSEGLCHSGALVSNMYPSISEGEWH